MNRAHIPPPQPGDNDPYYNRYITRFRDTDVVDVLTRQSSQAESMFSRISDENGHYRYAEGKWTVNELLQHIIDTERVFGYRALAISRGEIEPLPGFEQDEWAPLSGASNRLLSELLAEFEIVRASTYMLISRMSEEQLQRKGIASGNPLKVMAIPYILAGHFAHHADILLERYNAVIS